MSRIILFRGKRVDNGEWVEGYLSMPISHSISHGEITNVEDYYFSAIRIKPNSSFFETTVKATTVGQFTGLLDKNGKKIFEGDIVRTESLVFGTKQKYVRTEIGYILFLQQTMGYVIVFDKYDSRLGHRSRGGSYTQDPSIEVIGNVCDTPELLKEKS